MSAAWRVGLGLGCAALVAHAQPNVLMELAGPGSQPAPPWRVVGLPRQAMPLTRFEVVDLDGRRVLRIESSASYGNLVHAVQAQPGTLSWSWRVDRPATGADLQRKEADDAALKVCAMFDLPLDALPFWERQKMRMARGLAGEPLPAATLCYVAEPSLAPGAVLPNVYTGRLRWIGLGSVVGRWQHESRDLRADFLRAFGHEAAVVPRLSAIAVGADLDNTGGRALAYVADLVLQP